MNELSAEVIIKELETPDSDLWLWSYGRHYLNSNSRLIMLVTIKDDADFTGDISGLIWIAK
jgi:hypothetical protein